MEADGSLISESPAGECDAPIRWGYATVLRRENRVCSADGTPDAAYVRCEREGLSDKSVLSAPRETIEHKYAMLALLSDHPTPHYNTTTLQHNNNTTSRDSRPTIN